LFTGDNNQHNPSTNNAAIHYDFGPPWGKACCTMLGQEEDSSAHWLCPHHHMYIYVDLVGNIKSMNIPPK
jgi:hypothetical protein